MSNTILITGASSGFGFETARFFQQQGWNVIATMRSPEKGTQLASLENVYVTCLDVQNQASIANAIEKGLARFGSIDALVNNAGYGLMGVFECASRQQIQKQFDINLFGLMDVTRAVLPYMRKQGHGSIINISSFGGQIGLPFGSLYNSSKFAVEGFSEALSHELYPLGIKVKLIEPGGVATNFRNSLDMIRNEVPAYDPLMSGFFNRYAQTTAHLPKATPQDVAQTIFNAVTDGSSHLRYPVGSDAEFYIQTKYTNPDPQFITIMRNYLSINNMENTLQQPVDNGFTAASTAEDVIKGINLNGKTAIVTGGYSGIGLETARILSEAGAKVIVPARDTAKAKSRLENLNVELEEMDLMNPASIDAFAERFNATGRPLHILVNSAGIMAAPLVRDSRGYESQFATNHLGHFQLTARLWPALQKADGARVVSVSSWGHRFSPVIFDDPNFNNREYDRIAAYGQSKTANILFAVQLDQSGRKHNVRAFAVHPGGIIDTDLSRHYSLDDLRSFGVLDENDKPILDPSRQLKTVQQGASTSVWCATSPQLEGKGGVYCENNNISPVVPDDVDFGQQVGSMPLGVLRYAIEPKSAQQLWTLSEQLTGITFNI